MRLAPEPMLTLERRLKVAELPGLVMAPYSSDAYTPTSTKDE